MPKREQRYNKHVAQWATIAHLRARIMFGNTIFYNAQKQVTLEKKVKVVQWMKA